MHSESNRERFHKKNGYSKNSAYYASNSMYTYFNIPYRYNEHKNITNEKNYLCFNDVYLTKTNLLYI